ncbi:MAG: AI-2E family transporter [Thermoanaerobaculia bacterium]
MPKGSLGSFTRKVAIVLVMLGGVAFLWSVRRVLILLFIAAVLAAGIAPIVRRVRLAVRIATHRRIQRGPAVLIVYLPFFVAVVLLVVFTLPNLVIESRALATELPRLVEQRLLRPLEDYVPIDQIRELMASVGSAEDGKVFVYLRSAANVIGSIVAVLFLVFYMLIDADRLRNLFLLIFPAEERHAKKRMIRRMSKRMSSWLSGQLLLAAIVGGATFVGLTLLGIPYAIPLSVIAAIGEMVPVIGPIVGGMPAVTVALFQSTPQFWMTLVLAIGIQQLENLILVPRLMGKKVSVSPLAVFVAFMMGAASLGLIGAVMAIPAAALLQVVFEEMFVVRRERRRDTDRPGTLLKATDE